MENPTENDFSEMAETSLKSYCGGINEKVFGGVNIGDTVKDIKRRFDNYAVTNTWYMTSAVRHKNS